MKKKNDQIIDTESPQKSLEKILKTEIQVAQRISEAKEQSERMVIAARDDVVSLKECIINATRDEREKVLAEGIETANDEAQKKIEKAEQDSKHFFATSKQYIANAAENVIQVVLGSEDGSI
jgi:vacuolar-type H+-ATPase subunit H